MKKNREGLVVAKRGHSPILFSSSFFSELEYTLYLLPRASFFILFSLSPNMGAQPPHSASKSPLF